MWRLGLAAVLCLTGLPSKALAKGEGGGISGFCFGQELLYAYVVRFPEDEPDQVIVATNFGLLVSRDRGATYGWVCPEIYAVLPDGRIFILTGGLGYGLSSAGICGFDRTPDQDLATASLVSVAVRPGSSVVYGAASWPGMQARPSAIAWPPSSSD